MENIRRYFQFGPLSTLYVLSWLLNKRSQLKYASVDSLNPTFRIWFICLRIFDLKHQYEIFLPLKIKPKENTYINLNSFCFEYLKFGPVIWYPSVKFVVVFVPFYWIKCVSLHIKLTNKRGFITNHPVSRHINSVEG